MILVTGGTGYIGSHTCVALAEAGYKTLILDNLSNSQVQVLTRLEQIIGTRPEGHVAALKYCRQNTRLFTANLGTGRGHSVLDVIQTFEAVNQCRVPYQIVERRPGDIAQCWADSSFVAKNLGWRATRDLKHMR